MASTREDARLFIADNTKPSATPVVTEEQIERCIDRSRIVDAWGRKINEPGYVETIWATRAAVLVMDIKVNMAAGKVDIASNGQSVKNSQRPEQLERVRRSLRANMLPGSP